MSSHSEIMNLFYMSVKCQVFFSTHCFFYKMTVTLTVKFIPNLNLLIACSLLLLLCQGQAKLVFSVYKNLGNWLVPSPESPSSFSSNVSQECANSTNCTFINSLIISASVNSRSTLSVPLTSPVVFTLQHNSVCNICI